ncbi:MAG: BREX-4 system phosphatase PglZ [Parabacteroides sp.]|nr:BREX-4 system phosphatase PglZ [Parabacteroides sp.]
MNIDSCIKKINKYLDKKDVQPYIVDVQNSSDLSDLITHYNVGANEVISAKDYCNDDEFPHIDTLLNELSHKQGTVFVTGLSSFLKLQGEKVLKDTLKNILSMTGHIIIVTYQCAKLLKFSDPRLINRISVIDGDESPKPSVVFASDKISLPKEVYQVKGLHNISTAIETTDKESIYIITEKEKGVYPLSLISISNLNKAYDVLCMNDSSTSELLESWGSYEQWNYAVELFGKYSNWADIIDSEIGNHKNLDLFINSYVSFTPLKKWLYFIGLKLNGASNNWVLNTAIKRANNSNELIKQIYRSILELQPTDKTFKECYMQRRVILQQIGAPIGEIVDFCKIVLAKEINAIYYLTDTSDKEKELIFSLLDKYGLDFGKENLIDILSVVYPNLAAYLSTYRFKNELLDSYFDKYKYQKVINKLLPEFESIVVEQAEKREYNLILQPRTSITEKLDKTNSQLYFMDAMGVEYLGYIMSVCKDLDLMANITVCRCELPSITSANKEFLDLFASSEHPTISVKDLDELKHHGEGDYDYRQTKLPIHLSKELEIIREVLEKIKGKLIDGSIDKAVMISDHGSSRLAVLSETENIWEMNEKGEHSGRCCLKSDVDEQPSFATDAGDFWALANYDRFKGGRKANVEVHGGATLEEIVVPIIELTYLNGEIEVHIMPLEDSTFTLGKTPEISVSFRKKAAIKIFSTTKLQNVSVLVDGKYYEASEEKDNFYTVEMSDIKKPKTYFLDVLANDNTIASQLPLIVKSEGMGSNNKGIL